MTDTRPPVILSVASRSFRVHEHLNSTSFATSPDDDAVVIGQGQQPALLWEITLPELTELASKSTDHRAVINAWRGGEKVGQIEFEYSHNFDGFTMTFVSKGDFTSIHVLSLSTPTTVVVIRSAMERRVVLIDSQTHAFIGGDIGPNDLNVVTFPAQNVRTGMQLIRDGVNALANGPRVVFSDSSVRAKQRCQNNRKAGWVGAIALAVAGALAVPSGGSSLVVVGGFLAAGAAGGAAAAVVENTSQQCMEDAEAKEAAEEEKDKQDEEGGE